MNENFGKMIYRNLISRYIENFDISADDTIRYDISISNRALIHTAFIAVGTRFLSISHCANSATFRMISRCLSLTLFSPDIQNFDLQDLVEYLID